MELISLTFENECPTIKVEFNTDLPGQNYYQRILIAKVIGIYRNGSEGNPDAEYIYGMIKTAIELWHPKALIIDLSKLEYTFGDKIEVLYGVAHPIKSAILVGEGCRKGLSTLDFGINTTKDITENKNFFDDMKDSVKYINQSVDPTIDSTQDKIKDIKKLYYHGTNIEVYRR